MAKQIDLFYDNLGEEFVVTFEDEMGEELEGRGTSIAEALHALADEVGGH